MKHETKSAIANITLAVTLFVGTSALAVWALNVGTEPKSMSDMGLPPCNVEDQVAPDCYWDADERSNGRGVSFIVVDGTVTFEDGTTQPAQD